MALSLGRKSTQIGTLIQEASCRLCMWILTLTLSVSEVVAAECGADAAEMLAHIDL